jgi:hypothetical protein
MPKIIEVALDQISCLRNGFGGEVLVSGNIFGAEFQDDPDDPDDQRTVKSIFPFPAGPIAISEGETTSITMSGVRFSLSAPSIEPPTLGPKFLKIGGDLSSGLGSNFFTIRFDHPLPFADTPSTPPAVPARFDLGFSQPNLEIVLGFDLFVAQVF